MQKPLPCCYCHPISFQLLIKDRANGGISVPGKVLDLHPAIILNGGIRNEGHKGSGCSGSFHGFETLPIGCAFSF
jgi:hypothetical protein